MYSQHLIIFCRPVWISEGLPECWSQAAEAAKDFTSKLWVSGTAEAKSSVMRLAGDVSSWWAALDPGATSSADKPQDSNRSAQVMLEIAGPPLT